MQQKSWRVHLGLSALLLCTALLHAQYVSYKSSLEGFSEITRAWRPQRTCDALRTSNQPRTYEQADVTFACQSGFPPLPGIWQGAGTNWSFPDDVNQYNATECLLGAGVDQIYILGDSQGVRYFSALIKSLKTANFVCAHIDRESGPAYFSVAETVYGQQDCSGCMSSRIICRQPYNMRALDIEYVRMEFVIDAELTTQNKTNWQRNCLLRTGRGACKWAWNTQLFLFEYYFPRRLQSSSGTQHFHIFQNIHDCSRRTHNDFRRDAAWLVDLVDTALPSSAHVFYWEATAPDPSKQGTMANVTTLECIVDMHAETKKILLPLVRRRLVDESVPNTTLRLRPIWHATFGILEPTITRVNELSIDGVHLVKDWYEIVVQMLMSAYCTHSPGGSFF